MGGKLIDRLWPNPEERDAAKLKLLDLQQNGELAQLAADTDLAKAQMAINQAEASNNSIWASGWRPYVGWVCGTGFAYHIIIQPLLAFVFAAVGHPVDLPVFNSEIMTSTLFGMLGFGAMRSYDKSTQKPYSPRQVRKTDIQNEVNKP